jgi:hypothetical protein
MTNTAVEEWLDQLDDYGVEFVILDLDDDCDLVEVLHIQASWIVDFQDGKAVIFARTTPGLVN